MNKLRCNSRYMVPAILVCMTGSITPAIAEPAWTLQSSINRVLQVAPETRAGTELLEVRQDELEQANMWPNPEIELRADESIGLSDGSGGFDFTELVIRQPIPFKRLGSVNKQAEAALRQMSSINLQQQLKLEHQAAMLFHELQLKTAIYALSQQRLKIANQFSTGQSTEGAKKDQLVRYLSPLEKTRLSILRETARQAATNAEGKLNETASEFRILLNLKEVAIPEVPELKLLSQQYNLVELQQGLTAHPYLKAAQSAIDSAEAEINTAKASRYKDPTVNLFIERDSFNNQRETYTGLSVSMEVPLWNKNSQAVSKARAGLISSRTDFDLQLRELNSQLQQSYLHYGHLLEQAHSYKEQLLKPAEQMFKLSRNSFAAGEQNILGLIDSHNTYFEIRRGYLELLADIGKELASLRLAAGLSTVNKAAQGGDL